MRKAFFLVVAIAMCDGSVLTTADANSGEPWRVHALVGARVVISPEKTLPVATVIIRDGVIEAVGEDLIPPPDARVWNVAGKTLYPGLVDAYVPASQLGDAPPKDDAKPADDDGPRQSSKQPGDSHDLPWVHPDLRVADHLTMGTKALRAWRSSGFVAVHVVPNDGIFRGSTAVVSLGSRPVNEMLLRDGVAQVIAYESERSEYPSSTMGIVALIRQTMSDARWYRDTRRAFALRPSGRMRPAHNRALAALDGVVDGTTPVLFDAANNTLGGLRSSRIAAEHNLRIWLLGSGSEYHRLDEVAALGVPVILPLDFPEPPAVEQDDDEWGLISTDDLRHWDRAPHNPAWLLERGVQVALTSHRLDGPKELAARVRKAIAAGLDAKLALAALTTVPAKLLGVDGYLGTIAVGKAASFIVADGELFGDKTRIEAVWVDGARYDVDAKLDETPHDITGATVLSVATAATTTTASATRLAVLDINSDKGKLGGTLLVAGSKDTVPLDCVELRGDRLLVGVDGTWLGSPGPALLDVTLSDIGVVGELVTAVGQHLRVAAERTALAESKPGKAPLPKRDAGPLLAPDVVLITGATIWTQGPAGKLDNADLLLRGGRIEAVGRGLTVPNGAVIIDAHGKHVTPGLIDAHSHTAIDGGVNEATRTVTAEVRIGDVVDSEDWNIYSELAGGLTTANLLHGSANPMGGQSQTIKLRWGNPPELLKFVDGKPGIKFALGENVKQSNWGDKFTERYPQTRLGVEQAIRERFLAAQDYMRTWATYRQDVKSDPQTLPPRTDLQLETFAEILRHERLIHCHSYRQDEILMLIRLMDEFGVTIGTFQHVLEGYKVADEIAAHGAGASTFSDWWGYKFEVYDAIPYNGALMWDRGVVVSFNSDSDELARRLAVEATKAIKYGGVPEVEALNMVTLNPARQLRIDQRVGSLEPGKDGDFVIWNGDPLSTQTLAEQTWIEGRKYFDRAIDLQRRPELAKERERLIERVRKAPKSKGGDEK